MALGQGWPLWSTRGGRSRPQRAPPPRPGQQHPSCSAAGGKGHWTVAVLGSRADQPSRGPAEYTIPVELFAKEEKNLNQSLKSLQKSDKACPPTCGVTLLTGRDNALQPRPSTSHASCLPLTPSRPASWGSQSQPCCWTAHRGALRSRCPRGIKRLGRRGGSGLAHAPLPLPSRYGGQCLGQRRQEPNPWQSVMTLDTKDPRFSCGLTTPASHQG